jgi:PBP1b-binding outer membrane lipoprotein LpoB
MKRIITAIMIGALVLAACSGDTVEDVTSEIEDATNASVSDEVEQDAVDLATDVEQQMDTLSNEIQNSEAADDLQNAWNDIQNEVTAAIASMQTDGTISTEGLEQELNEFQTELDAAGDEIAPEVRDAWTSLRTSIEQMMS